MLSTQTKQLSRNIPLLYTSSIIGGMLFFLPIVALYYESTLFSLTNVAIIYATEGIVSVLFQIPAGAIADLFGRKKTVVLGNFVGIIALVFLAIGGSMLMFILFAVILAIASSLVRGADSALLYDTLKQLGREKIYQKTIGTYYALWAVGATIGSIAGGYMAESSFRLPILMTFIPLTIALVVTLFFIEPEYDKEKHSNVFQQMRSTLNRVISQKQILLIIISGFTVFAFGEGLLQLTPIFFEFKTISVVSIGYLVAGMTALMAIGEYSAYLLAKNIGNKNILLLAGFGVPVFILLATFTQSMTAGILIVIPTILFGLRHTTINYWLNESIDSSKRATLISIDSSVSMLGITLASPFLGYFADLYDINAAFKLFGVLLFIVPIFYLFLKDIKPQPHHPERSEGSR
ncbi:MFS transporter [Patescibacteria group bacterium]